jgi:hypothetical protein
MPNVAGDAPAALEGYYVALAGGVCGIGDEEGFGLGVVLVHSLVYCILDTHICSSHGE